MALNLANVSHVINKIQMQKCVKQSKREEVDKKREEIKARKSAQIGSTLVQLKTKLYWADQLNNEF